VHTEMFVDSMMELYEQGVITNARKAFRPGKFITTFAMGSRKLYDWLDDNVAVDFQRGRWVNNPAVIRENSRMVSVNNCISVDLTGQVASESIGPAQYSAPAASRTRPRARWTAPTGWARASSPATAPPRAAPSPPSCPCCRRVRR